MTVAERIAAQQHLEDSRAYLQRAEDGIAALSDTCDPAQVRAATTAVETALTNVGLLLDGLRFA